MGERIKAHCNECCRKTNQGILYEQSIKQEEDKIYYSSVSRYIMIQCLGCDSISFMTFEKFGIEKKQPESEWDEICHQYPEADIFDMGDFEILAEEIYGRFPAIIRDVYEEIESAVKHNALLLTGLGLRTLIEAICIQQNIEGKNLMEKIKNLHSSGLISSTEVPILDKLRVIGNFSAHQIKRMSDTQLSYALRIINHVVISVYVLPKINKNLKV